MFLCSWPAGQSFEDALIIGVSMKLHLAYKLEMQCVIELLVLNIDS